MNVLYIGKYPPLEGGTSAAAYWRIREFNQHGISFEILTCISTNADYVIEEFTAGKNVHVLREKVPWHIPYSPLYSERLISAAIELSTLHDFDAVEGCYLFPYGFAAYIVAEMYRKPLILRHAGSDLYRVSQTANFKILLSRMAKFASAVITYEESTKIWEELGASKNLYSIQRYVPNPLIFKSSGAHTNTTFLGKITEKWNRRQFVDYLKFLKARRYSGTIYVYSNEYTVGEFARFFQDHGYDVIGNPFVSPDKVPGILQDTKYLLISEPPDGIPERSNNFAEALSSGCVPVCSGITQNYVPKTNYEEFLRSQIEVYLKVI